MGTRRASASEARTGLRMGRMRIDGAETLFAPCESQQGDSVSAPSWPPCCEIGPAGTASQRVRQGGCFEFPLSLLASGGGNCTANPEQISARPRGATVLLALGGLVPTLVL